MSVELKFKDKINSLCQFIDIKNEKDKFSTFTRRKSDIFHFEEYFYIDGEIILKTKEKKHPF